MGGLGRWMVLENDSKVTHSSGGGSGWWMGRWMNLARGRRVTHCSRMTALPRSCFFTSTPRLRALPSSLLAASTTSGGSRGRPAAPLPVHLLILAFFARRLAFASTSAAAAASVAAPPLPLLSKQTESALFSTSTPQFSAMFLRDRWLAIGGPFFHTYCSSCCEELPRAKHQAYRGEEDLWMNT